MRKITKTDKITWEITKILIILISIPSGIMFGIVIPTFKELDNNIKKMFKCYKDIITDKL